MSPNDTVLPPGVSEEEIAYYSAFVLCAGVYIFSADLSPVQFEDNGMTDSFNTYDIIDRESGNGWIGIETALIRLGSSYTPNASFPVWADPIADPQEYSTKIGYDAVVCVEMCEPWIVQIYNSSLGVPKTMASVGKSTTTDFEPDDRNTGPHLGSYTRVLNSTGKGSAFYGRYAGGFSLERY